MLIPGETFPYTDLTENQLHMLSMFCGANPLESWTARGRGDSDPEDVVIDLAVNDEELVRNFLGTSGRPRLEKRPISQVVMNTKKAVIPAAGLTSPNARLSFNRGAYLYAGILGDVIGVDDIPVDLTVALELDELQDDCPEILERHMYRQGCDIPSLDRVMSSVGTVLVGKDREDTHAFLLGMGTVDYIARKSIEAGGIEQVIDASHADFNELFDFIAEYPGN